MIEMMIEAQVVMDKQTINERYADMVVSVATETGWTIDHVLDLPPWTLNQVVESKERIIKNVERDNTLGQSVKKDRVLGG